MKTTFWCKVVLLFVLLISSSSTGIPHVSQAQDDNQKGYNGLDVIFLMDNSWRMDDPATDPDKERYSAITYAAQTLSLDALYHHPGMQHRVVVVNFTSSVSVNVGLEDYPLGPYNDAANPAYAALDRPQVRRDTLSALSDELRIEVDQIFTDSAFPDAVSRVGNIVEQADTPRNRKQVVFLVLGGNSYYDGDRNEYIRGLMRQFNGFMEGNELHVIILPVDAQLRPNLVGSVAPWEAARMPNTVGKSFLMTDAAQLTSTIDELLWPNLAALAAADGGTIYSETLTDVSAFEMPTFASSATFTALDGSFEINNPPGLTVQREDWSSSTAAVTVLADPPPVMYAFNGAHTVRVSLRMGRASLIVTDTPQWTQAHLTSDVRDVFNQVIHYPGLAESEKPSVGLTVRHLTRSMTWNIGMIADADQSGHLTGQFIPPYAGDYSLSLSLNTSTPSFPADRQPQISSAEWPYLHSDSLRLELAAVEDAQAQLLVPRRVRFNLAGLNDQALAVSPTFTLNSSPLLLANQLTAQPDDQPGKYSLDLTFIGLPVSNRAEFALTAQVTIPTQPNTAGETTFSLPEGQSFVTFAINVASPEISLTVADNQPMLTETAIALVPQGDSLPSNTLADAQLYVCADVVQTNPLPSGQSPVQRHFRLSADTEGHYTGAFVAPRAGTYQVSAALRADCEAMDAVAPLGQQTITAWPVYMAFVGDDQQPVSALSLKQFVPQSVDLRFYVMRDQALDLIDAPFALAPVLSAEPVSGDNALTVDAQAVTNSWYTFNFGEARFATPFDLTVNARIAETGEQVPFWSANPQASRQIQPISVEPIQLEITFQPLNGDTAQQFERARVRVTLNSGGDAFDAAAFQARGGQILATFVVQPEGNRWQDVPLIFDKDADPPAYSLDVPLPVGHRYDLDLKLRLVDAQGNSQVVRELTADEREQVGLQVTPLTLQVVEGDLNIQADELHFYRLAWVDSKDQIVEDAALVDKPKVYYIDPLTSAAPSPLLARDQNRYSFSWETSDSGAYDFSAYYEVPGPDGQPFKVEEGGPQWRVQVGGVRRLFLSVEEGAGRQYFYENYVPFLKTRLREEKELVFEVVLRVQPEQDSDDTIRIVDYRKALENAAPALFMVSVGDVNGVALPAGSYSVEVKDVNDSKGVRVWVRGLTIDTEYMVKVNLPPDVQTQNGYKLIDSAAPATAKAWMERDPRSSTYLAAYLGLNFIIPLLTIVTWRTSRRLRFTRPTHLASYLCLKNQRGRIVWHENLNRFKRNTRELPPPQEWRWAKIRAIMARSVPNQDQSVELDIWRERPAGWLYRAIRRLLKYFPRLNPFGAPTVSGVILREGEEVEVFPNEGWYLSLMSDEPSEESDAEG